MTISSQIRKAGPFVGNDSSTVFPFAFKVFAASDLYVVKTDTTLGTDTVLVLNTDYTVSLNTDQDANPGGTVTLPSALATSFKLTVTSSLQYLQPTDLTNQGGFYPKVITNALDRLTIFVQQLAEKLGRSISLPISVTGVSTELPVPAANHVIAWNDTATGLQSLAAEDLATIVAFGTANADVFDGDGATTQFALSGNPGALNNLDVSIGGVTQTPGVDYTWTAGTTITFASAPPVGTGNVLVRYMQGLPQSGAQAAPFNPAGVGAIERTIQDKLSESVSLSDYDTLRNALATGKRVLVPSSVTSIAVSATDSPYVLPLLNLIDAEAPLTLSLASGLHTTSSGNIANVGQNGNISVVGATPINTTLSSIASVSGSSGNYSVVVNVASAAGIAVGDYLKIDNAVPLIHLSGDLSVFRKREAQNELLRTSALLGTITATTGGGSASWSSVGSGVLSEYVAVGDLITIKGQTRVVSSVSVSSVNITGAWTLGVSGSRDYFVSRPNSGTVSTGGVSSATVTGSSSAFTTEANVGDLLLCDGQMAVITAIGGDTSMTVSPAVTITAGTAYSIITPAVAHEGTHRVTNVAGNAVTVLNHWRGPFAPPVNRISGGDVQAIKTVLYNSGSGDGFSFGQNSSLNWINDLVLRGSNGSTGTHGLALNGRSVEGPTQIGPTGMCCTGDGFAAVEWGRGAFIGVGGNLQSRKSHYCGNLAFGVWAMEGAKVGMREAIVSGNDGRGLQINAGSTLLFTEGHAAGNTSDGVNLLDGATLYGEIPFFWQNGGMGVRLGGTTGCHISNGACGVNGASGLYAHFNALCDLSLAMFVGNARENIEAYGGSTIHGASMWSVGSRGTVGNGRGIYAEHARIAATDCAINGNSGGPVELSGASGLLDAPSSFIRGTANGGIRVRKNAQAVLTSGKPEAVTVATGGNILIDSVSPTPTISGVERVNEYANDKAIVNTAAGTSFGINALTVDGGSRVTFFKMVTQVFDCPSIAAGGQATTTVTVTGALTSGMVAMVNSNSVPAGVSLSAHILSTDTVTVTFNNNSGGALDPGNATLTVVVIGSS